MIGKPLGLERVPAECERRDCTEPVYWVLHWEERGAPGPAFACHQHGRRSDTRREPLEAWLESERPVSDEEEL